MKTALITGANKGIGFETAKQLLQKGYHVFITARDEAKGEQALEQLKRRGFLNISFVQMDVASPSSNLQAKENIAAQIKSLDVLVNNAGIRGNGPQAPSVIAIEDVRRVFETNFFGVIQVTQAFMPLLKLSAEPRIVNVTSDLASLTLHNDPSWRYYAFKGAAYGPSKTALNAYTVSLAYELRDTPFKVNAVNPGYTKTDFNENRGTKTAEDAAQIIVQYATLGNDGPTGKFISDYGESPW